MRKLPCTHGHALRRKCGTCSVEDDQQEIATLTAQLAEAEKKYDQLFDSDENLQGVLMKRYQPTDWLTDHGTCPADYMHEATHGAYMETNAVRGRDLEMTALVEALPHSSCCGAYLCTICGWPVAIAHVPDNDDPTFHAAQAKICDCPRGKLLALLGETK
jgi:hypothetical protein